MTSLPTLPLPTPANQVFANRIDNQAAQTSNSNKDEVIISFIDPRQTPEVAVVSGEITDWVSINMEKDFFIPADGCTIVIEDDRAVQYIKYMQRGNKVQIFLNGNLNMTGYIFSYQLDYARDGHGTKLTVECKDLLEYMAQGSIPPNGGTDAETNFHFPASFTLYQCCNFIANAFNNSLLSTALNTPGNLPPNIKVVVDDNNGIHGALNVAAGFNLGGRKIGTKSSNFTKSIQKALNHNNQPHKGESYLEFMNRLVKLGGGYIKMAPGTDDTIVIQSPTYDRTQASPFYLNHFISANTDSNNVISAELKFDLNKQPSVIIMESNAMNTESFSLNDEKIIAINELTGFPLVKDINDTTFPLAALASVDKIVSQLVYPNRLNSPNQQGTGYYYVPFNLAMYKIRYNLSIDINTDVCMMRYATADNNITALDRDQLSFNCANALAEVQDKYVEFIYEVDGWSQLVQGGESAIWQPNMMVSINEEALSPGKPKKIDMWIRKVNYIKDRHRGTRCILHCSLPYTHRFELSDVISPPSSEVNSIPYRKLTIAQIAADGRNKILNQQNYHEYFQNEQPNFVVDIILGALGHGQGPAPAAGISPPSGSPPILPYSGTTGTY